MSPATVEYSVPQQASQLLQDGVLDNPLIRKSLPSDIAKYASKVRFEGSHAPIIPINWRFAESVSALKGLEAAMLLAFVKRKYGADVGEVVINTDHAQLFVMSTLVWTIEKDGSEASKKDAYLPEDKAGTGTVFPSNDIHRQQATPHRGAVTNIYKTKDNRFFHLHGSMNPDPSLDSIGLPHEMPAATPEEAWKPFMEKMSQLDSAEMQHLASDVHKQAGTICWTTDEFRASEHGKANAHIGLFEVREHANSTQKPCWWPEAPHTSAKRPLGGLKVVDITRVIAAPAITRGLAELGASVMRVTAPHLADYSSLHCDMNWGKWNASLDFRKEEDREKLRELIREADVVVTAYRPHVLDKYGLGEEGILEICKERERGIVYVRENCYGWYGPWKGRSGWQQISDACCGVSMEFGRAMGNDEAVTPVFPNSDYCTGIAGVTGILRALMLRAEKGGSYSVDAALNYYSQWLVNSCGTYPTSVWQSLWSSYDKPVFRHYHNMMYSIPRMLKLLKEKNGKGGIFEEDFFESREARNRGVRIRTVKPILRFKGGEVQPGFQVGTRGNGVDQPRWPNDLLVEVVE
ncbi:CoA-transferase family III [Aulographum hederae CBS 113979]|uniref:CoA-transferase family III n=1 Tax=Aulographum hederae CBS 113979 TaxID=1176131 RepID=A0A6G1GV66_9PEZI|nr:CoA-transferase family III [Aulographum hederae CBS 113979]